MKFVRITLASLLTFLASCTSYQAQRLATAQGGTITDMQYEEILSNFARLRQAPGALPWHVTVQKGTASSQGSASPSFSYGWPAISKSLGLSGSYQQQTSWDLVPVDDPDFLKHAIRIYQKHLNDEWIQDGKIPSGESGVSGRHGRHSVWVRNSDLKALTDFSLEILDAEKVPVDGSEPAAGKGSGASGSKSRSGVKRQIPLKTLLKLSSPSGAAQMLQVPLR